MFRSNSKIKNRSTEGYVLIDVLIAIFLFSLGFSALYALNENALLETKQAININEAANLAQEVLEQLSANSWSNNISLGLCNPNGEVSGEKGIYKWTLNCNWVENPNLLQIDLKINWLEQGHLKKYVLTSLYYVQ